MPIDVDDLGVLSALVDGLVCFDKFVGSMGLHTFGVNVVAIKFDSNHDIFVSTSGNERNTTSLVCVHGLFGIVEYTEVDIMVFNTGLRCAGWEIRFGFGGS